MAQVYVICNAACFHSSALDCSLIAARVTLLETKSKLSVPSVASVLLRNKSQHLESLLKDSRSSFSCLKWCPVTLASLLFPQPPRKLCPGPVYPDMCLPSSSATWVLPQTQFSQWGLLWWKLEMESLSPSLQPLAAFDAFLQSIHHHQTSVNWFILFVHSLSLTTRMFILWQGLSDFCSLCIHGVSTRLGTLIIGPRAMNGLHLA